MEDEEEHNEVSHDSEPFEYNKKLNSSELNKNRLKLKKRKSKAPVELPNNVKFNPYGTNAFLNHGSKLTKKVIRDPRFSDFSGKLNIDMFEKSYDFLKDMRNEEVKDIKKVIKINKKFGVNSVKGMESMKNIAHLNIFNLDEAKRALDKYKSEKVAIEKKEEFRKLKKSLVQEEKEKIAKSGKKPYYFTDKKVKKIFKEIKRKENEESMKSTSIMYGPNKKIHKKIESQNKKNLRKERKLNNIPHRREF